MIKKLILFVLSAAMLFCGCTQVNEYEEEEAVMADVTVTEAAPYPVTVGGLTFNSSPETVGSLSPAVTEMIFELGFGDRLVCRSEYCNYPEEAENIPAAGSAANPDIDGIISAAPALLITQSPIANKDITRLSQAGISVLSIPAPRSADELGENYRSLSLIFSGSLEGETRAEEATADLRAALNDAKGSCESLVFIMNITADGFSAATGDSFAGDYAAHFGRNIAAANTSLTLTPEELLDADPQVILLAHPLESSDIDPELSSQLSAFERGHVFVINPSLIERPTTRLAGITRKISETVRNDTGGADYAEIPETSAETVSEALSEDVNE
ncbi:MAG: helical backbone metal receptor [Oscillospiraceae bacterium]|nr:helical backbone metal receptor [Oscillospiraceae bacterium]